MIAKMKDIKTSKSNSFNILLDIKIYLDSLDEAMLIKVVRLTQRNGQIKQITQGWDPHLDDSIKQ